MTSLVQVAYWVNQMQLGKEVWDSVKISITSKNNVFLNKLTDTKLNGKWRSKTS